MGLCLIEAGLLQSVQPLYDKSNGKFNFNEFRTFLHRFEEKYKNCPLLTFLVKNMVNYQIDDRPDFLELKSQLPDWFVLMQAQKSIIKSIQSNPKKNISPPVEIKILEEDFPEDEPSMNERKSTKKEILEFFNLKSSNAQNESGIVEDRSNFSRYLNSLKGQENRVLEEKNDRITKTIIQDSRTSLTQDLFIANNIEKYVVGSTGFLFKATTDTKIEKNDRGEVVERTYIKYVEILDQTEKEIAKRYVEQVGRKIESNQNLRKGSTPVLDATGDDTIDFHLSEIDLTYSAPGVGEFGRDSIKHSIN